MASTPRRNYAVVSSPRAALLRARGCGPVQRFWRVIDASFIPDAWRSTAIVHWS
jgi:hypothetical protein